MKARLRELQAAANATWQGRGPAERVVIAVAAAILSIILCLALLHVLDRARLQMRENTVPALRASMALLDEQAAEYERLRAAPPAPSPQTELRALVQAQAAAAGLAPALQSVEGADANQVKVVFGAVAFADWLNWIAKMEVHRVRVETCRIEALATPGLVGVTASLARPARP